MFTIDDVMACIGQDFKISDFSITYEWLKHTIGSPNESGDRQAVINRLYQLLRDGQVSQPQSTRNDGQVLQPPTPKEDGQASQHSTAEGGPKADDDTTSSTTGPSEKPNCISMFMDLVEDNHQQRVRAIARGMKFLAIRHWGRIRLEAFAFFHLHTLGLPAAQFYAIVDDIERLYAKDIVETCNIAVVLFRGGLSFQNWSSAEISNLHVLMTLADRVQHDDSFASKAIVSATGHRTDELFYRYGYELHTLSTQLGKGTWVPLIHVLNRPERHWASDKEVSYDPNDMYLDYTTDAVDDDDDNNGAKPFCPMNAQVEIFGTLVARASLRDTHFFRMFAEWLPVFEAVEEMFKKDIMKHEVHVDKRYKLFYDVVKEGLDYESTRRAIKQRLAESSSAIGDKKATS